MGDCCNAFFFPQPMGHMGDCCNGLYKVILLQNHCHAHIYGSGACSYSQARATLKSVFSPGTAGSVMARPGTLCIATVTVLVILTAALQPGEHYLPESICICTSLCQCEKKMFAYKVKPLVTLQKKFFCISYIVFFFCFKFIIKERPQYNVSCRQCFACHSCYKARFAIAIIVGQISTFPE